MKNPEKLELLRAHYREIKKLEKEAAEIAHDLVHKNQGHDANKIERLKKFLGQKGRVINKMKSQWNQDRDYFLQLNKDANEEESIQKLLKIRL